MSHQLNQNLDPTIRRMALYVDADIKLDLNKLWFLVQAGTPSLGLGGNKVNDLLVLVIRTGIDTLMKEHVHPVGNMTLDEFLQAHADRLRNPSGAAAKGGEE